MSKTKKIEQVINGLKSMVKIPSGLFIATVVSVDEAEPSCTVKTLNDVEVYDVRLKASIENIVDGIVQIPKVDSTVIVATIGKEESELFVAAFSEVEKVMFYGGQQGGLVIWPNTKTELDKVKEMVTQIKNVITGAPIPEPGSGSPSALQAALSAAIGSIDLPSFEGLEDTKVLH